MRDEALRYDVDQHAMIESNMGEVKAGDFVEIRRSGRTFCGVAMPMLDDDEYIKSGKMDLLAVVVATGEMELVKSTDVMLQFPAFVDIDTALAAAPLKRDHVVATRAAEVNIDAFPPEAYDDHANAIPKALTPEREPMDPTRFHARARICYKIRLLQRNTDTEIRRLYPSFRALLLQERIAEDLVINENKSYLATRPEHALLHDAQKLLHSGSITTVEAAALIYKHNKAVMHTNIGRGNRLKADTLFAVHVLLMSHPMQFIADTTSHRRSQLFSYRSANEQRNLLRVIGWVRDTVDQLNASDPAAMSSAQRDSREIIDGFCKRARHVISWAKSNGMVTVAIGENGFSSDGRATSVPIRVPSLDGEGQFSWTASDKDIISFLKVSLGNRREIQEDPTKSVTMAIIKLVGAHIHLDPVTHHKMLEAPLKVKNMEKIREKIDAQRMDPVPDTTTAVQDGGYDLQQALVYNFLVRIGALAPWENPHTLDMYLKDYNVTADPFGKCENEQVLPIPTDRGARADFGQTPVYVIDSESASELDDGVSVEATSTPDEYWVHVHIADPTALIQPGTLLAQMAEQRYTSIYFPEEHYSMLPTDVVMNKMSLKNDTNEGQRVLSFSAKVSITNGKILDFNVKPGLVHNVKVFSYNTVNDIFAKKDVSYSVDTESRQDLDIIAKIASKLQHRRSGSGAVFTEMPKFDLEVSPLPLPVVQEIAPDYPRFFSGSPCITLNIASFSDDFLSTGSFDGLPGGISAETMVSELMIMTGRVAASMGIEQDIALPFRVQDAPTEEQVRIIEQEKHPLTAALPITTLQENQIFLPSAVFSTTPSQHYALGIKPMSKSAAESDALYHGGYARVTSPLRRYSDMLSHWQIKSACHQQQSPFKHGSVKKMLPRFDRMEAWAKQIEKSTVKYWIWVRIAMLLQKKHTLESTNLPLSDHLDPQEQMLLGYLPAVIGASDLRMDQDSRETKIRCNILPLGGTHADVTWPPHEVVPQRGTRLQVKINQAIAANTKRTLSFTK